MDPTPIGELMPARGDLAMLNWQSGHKETSAKLGKNEAKAMTSTVLAVIREGRIDTLEPIDFPDGVQVLVTVRSADDEGEFWQNASQKALQKAWDNTEDDVYAALLEK